MEKSTSSTPRLPATSHSAGMKLRNGGVLTYCRSLLGVLLKDFPQYQKRLSRPDKSYLGICNRNEKLEAAPDGGAYRCEWQWTSDLHAPKYLPSLGLRLMVRAFSDHPIVRSRAPKKTGGKPDVSYIIGHRGLQRLPHLLATLESIAGQSDTVIECIVVEQDVEAILTGRLPDWVTHIHTPPPTAGMPYCRSWAFNVGAKAALADVLVLHDNDMVIPADYSREILAKVKNGYEVVNLKRFIFYLSEKHSAVIFENAFSLDAYAPESIMQNSEGGGSIAVVKKAYEAIGGFDERFIGWGGEDNEFWERAQTLKVWMYANLPLIHLWHKSQIGKMEPNAIGKKLFLELRNTPVNERIKALREKMSEVNENSFLNEQPSEGMSPYENN